MYTLLVTTGQSSTVMLTEETLKPCVYWVDHLKTSSRCTRGLLTLTTSHFRVHHDLVGPDSRLSVPNVPFLSTSKPALRLSFPAVLCPSAVNTSWTFLYAAGAPVYCPTWYMNRCGRWLKVTVWVIAALLWVCFVLFCKWIISVEFRNPH